MPEHPIFSDPEFLAIKDPSVKAKVLRSVGVDPSGFTQASKEAKSSQRMDSVLEFIRPIASDIAAMGGAALGAPGGPAGIAAGAAGAYTAVDSVLQHIESQPPSGIISKTLSLAPGGLPDTLTNSAENAGLGKLASYGIKKTIQAGGAVVSTIGEKTGLTPVVKTSLQNLEATFSQQYPEGILKTMFGWMEDYGAPGAKRAAVERSATLGDKALKNDAFRISRQFDVNSEKEHKTLLGTVDRVKTQYHALADGAAKNAEAPLIIAKGNPLPAPVLNMPNLGSGVVGKPQFGPIDY